MNTILFSSVSKLFYVSIFCFFISTSVQGQEKFNSNQKTTFTVAGNCDMCKKRIEKAAFSVKGVKNAVWNVQTQKLALTFNEKKCSEIEVHKAIAKIGHDTEKIRTDDATYESLHHCCTYERLPVPKN
ncbi:heavy-metal-associated domain-containing protein [Capnocytophaga canimorsus]|uniref:heavy-metal-associated domain-containing protein n=1 Tax=Capnocytophaga canimorsus TaxID=28188 RepID=UPI000D6E4E0D|nr:heavy-metal-associated domain-containing protein [Capnocytophaga canimorsus]AWL78929.1 metal transporter [Capnocytophaga canimorsus]AYW37530.1 copper chaperone [Capnocytophaga canimorsus]MDT9498924.1 heavy-metal-associated domain-containing protein [Capnocytophaga canimorsus]